MKLRFLGTAASEGYPDAFCDCANCRQARALGGRSLRRRSAALIDEDLLIDFGPDLMAAALMDGFSLAQIQFCLQTHEHADHLDTTHFLSRSAYCGVHGNPRLQYFATQGALARAAAGLGPKAAAGLTDPAVGDRFNLTAHVVEPFRSFTVGPYRVRSVQAAHDPDHLVALLYLIERDGRTLFYATDTGELPAETWADLIAWSQGSHQGSHPATGPRGGTTGPSGGTGRRINVVAMDHTFGMQDRVQGHMNWQQFTEQFARMRAEHLLADDARLFAHHLAHHSNPPHEQLAEFAATHGYEVAYDGLVLDV